MVMFVCHSRFKSVSEITAWRRVRPRAMAQVIMACQSNAAEQTTNEEHGTSADPAASTNYPSW